MSPKGQERCRERPDLTWGPSSSMMGLQAAASLAESSRLCTALPDKETEAQREPGRCKARQQVQGMLGAELGSLPTDRSTWDPFRSGVGPRGGQERRGLGWSRGGRVRSRRQISKILNEVTGTTFPDHNDTHMGTRIRPGLFPDSIQVTCPYPRKEGPTDFGPVCFVGDFPFLVPCSLSASLAKSPSLSELQFPHLRGWSAGRMEALASHPAAG